MKFHKLDSSKHTHITKTSTKANSSHTLKPHLLHCIKNPSTCCFGTQTTQNTTPHQEPTPTAPNTTTRIASARRIIQIRRRIRKATAATSAITKGCCSGGNKQNIIFGAIHIGCIQFYQTALTWPVCFSLLHTFAQMHSLQEKSAPKHGCTQIKHSEQTPNMAPTYTMTTNFLCTQSPNEPQTHTQAPYIEASGHISKKHRHRTYQTHQRLSHTQKQSRTQQYRLPHRCCVLWAAACPCTDACKTQTSKPMFKYPATNTGTMPHTSTQTVMPNQREHPMQQHSFICSK